MDPQRDKNPRYLAYCRAHGESDPVAMLARDKEAWPGGRMCGYVLWMGDKWRAWRTANKRKADDVLTREDHQSFDAWLEEQRDA